MTNIHTSTFQDHVDYRLFQLCDEINAGCDAGFDFQDEELEREFAELRLHLSSYV